MAVVFEATDPRGYLVRCDDGAWQHAISGPAELMGHEAAVQAAIERPLLISQSRTHPSRQVCHGAATALGGRLGTGYIRVIVEFGATPGAMVTAMHTTKPWSNEVQLCP